MLLEEKDFKTQLKRNDVHPRCLFYGNESLLMLSYRRKLMELYEREGCGIEVYESRDTDFLSLLESSNMVSLLGEKRAIFIDDFESSLVPSECWDSFLEFCEDCSSGDKLVITAAEGFDIKGKARDKKLHSLFSHDLFAVNIVKHTGAVLRDEIRALCKRDGADLSGELASYLIEICGEDLETLKNECIKLSVYVGEGGTIKKEHIDMICAKRADANLYNLTSLLLRGDIKAVMEEINTLIAQKTAVIQIITNLTLSFYGLYAAACAREAGRTYNTAARELNERLEWRMRNYFRDSAKFKRQNLFAAFNIMVNAERDLKSKSVEDRVILETACVRAADALMERK